ncbi:hypothetical protein [Arthrobacter pigmenti]
MDASFTVMRHRETSVIRDRLSAALFVHGFDIPLAHTEAFAGAKHRGEKMLAGTGIESLGVRTNLRELNQTWEDVSGLAVASCLALFQNRFGVGLIGSTESYDELVIPWASSPITDHLFSTGSLEVIHDGAGYSRTEKVRALAQWPEAMEYLRVCWSGKDRSRNCGRCEKCIRTYLNFRSIGVEYVPCFEHQPTSRDIRKTMVYGSVPLNELKSISAYARKNGIKAEWVDALRFAIMKNSVTFPVVRVVLANDRLRGVAKSVARKVMRRG